MNHANTDGYKVQRIREILGIKQETLGDAIGFSQQMISKLEQKESIDDEMIAQIAKALHVSPEAIRNFDEDAAINIVQPVFNSHDQSTAIAYKSTFHFNPIDKLVEVMDENKKLYERLLESEIEKVKLLEKSLSRN